MPYLTCIVAAFDTETRTLVYTNAGHPPVLLTGPSGMRRLCRGGPPAGLLANATFEEGLLTVNRGDTCVLFSDGVTEALDETPVEGLLGAADLSARSAAEICDRVMGAALGARGPTAAQ